MSLEPLCLVFDMANPVPRPANEVEQLGQWYEWTLTDSPAGAVVHNGVSAEPDILAGRLYWVAQSAKVRYEEEGQWYDDVSTQVRTGITYALISLAALGGEVRCYRLQVMGSGRGTCTVRFSSRRIRRDFRSPEQTWTRNVAVTASTGDLELRPVPEEVTAFDLTIEEVASANLNEGYRHRHVALEVGVDGRLRNIGSGAKRVT